VHELVMKSECNNMHGERIKIWNNTFYYKVASCWLFLLIHTTIHGSINIRFDNTLFMLSVQFPDYKAIVSLTWQHRLISALQLQSVCLFYTAVPRTIFKYHLAELPVTN